MTDDEAIELIFERHFDAELYFAEYDRYPKGYDFDFDQAILVAAQALKEIRRYREMDRKLREVYGDCDELLETAVDGLCNHPGVDIRNPIKARLLIDEDVDKWDAYREIGTVEECREAGEKQKAKKPKDELKVKPVLDENGAYVDADMTVYLICPVCGEVVGIDDMCDRFCRECGQAIDWSEEE